MSRLFGQETESGVGFRAHHMSKVDTDEGLGPGSERQRQEVRKAQQELESRSKQKAAADAAPDSGPVKVDKNVDKNAVTEPGIGKVERKTDTVDDLLGGFGTDRPNLPRILPNADTTPPSDPVRKELTPTSPGKRQRARNMILATLVTFAVVAAVGVGLVKYGNNTSTTTPAPTVTVTVTTTVTAPAPTQTMSPITTTAIEALPTVKTSSPFPTVTATATTTKSVHSATTTTATATQTAPHPTGSAPPGMNLLPDDPHR